MKRVLGLVRLRLGFIGAQLFRDTVFPKSGEEYFLSLKKHSLWTNEYEKSVRWPRSEYICIRSRKFAEIRGIDLGETANETR
jgi:hypothetical protein